MFFAKKQQTAFSAEEFFAMRLKGFSPELSREELARQLLCLRFDFSYDSIGEDFIHSVHQALCQLPKIVLQAMHVKNMRVQLDFVSEIPAVTQMEANLLLISKHFVFDGQLMDITDNPIYPYGLSGILMHEAAHFLDCSLQSGVQLSNVATFNSSFERDLQAIPRELRIHHEERVELCRQHGGYLNLPPEDRLKADLALFSLQKEETYADLVAYITLGLARQVVMDYFPNTLQATGYLLGHYLRQVATSPPSGPV